MTISHASRSGAVVPAPTGSDQVALEVAAVTRLLEAQGILDYSGHVSLPRMLNDKDPEKRQRVFAAMMQMVKIDIAALQRAYDKA